MRQQQSSSSSSFEMISTSILYCNKLEDKLHPVDHRSLQPPPPPPPSDSGQPKSLDSTAISVLSGGNLSTSGVSAISNNRYRVRYLGCNTCDPRSHKLDNGIAAYQKPLLELYTTVLRRSVLLRTLHPSISLVNQVADLSSHGIVIAERDRFKGQVAGSRTGRPQSSASAASTKVSQSETVVTKVITPLSNILLWAAVKFQHRSTVKRVKNATNKRRQIGVAFVPLSCSDAVLDKNAFVTLNSKQRFLLGLQHPPLFACVLQKVNQNQRLECHLFVCLNSDDAIRMCNRMSELRHRVASIGPLQVPAPGGMGSYSYKSVLQSSAASMVSASGQSNGGRSSNFSDLSFTPKHIFTANSDIEEEVDDETEAEHQQSEHQQSAVSSKGVYRREFLSPVNGSHHHHHHQRGKNFKFKCDPRLYRERKWNPSDGLSWTELSSISSGLTSNKSTKSRLASHASVAKRDYRFESYKCPDSFVSIDSPISSLQSSKSTNEDAGGGGGSSRQPALANGQTSKWSSVSEELLNNRLFAKASAAAHLEADSLSPSNGGECNEILPMVVSDSNLASQRYFGDSLRSLKGFGTALSVAKPPTPPPPPPPPSALNNGHPGGGGGRRLLASCGELIDSSPPRQPKCLPKHRVPNVIPNGFTPTNSRSKVPSQHSTISNSIFLDNEDDFEASSCSSTRQKISSKLRSNSEESLAFVENGLKKLSVQVQRHQTPPPPPPSNNDKLSKTKSVPNIVLAKASPASNDRRSNNVKVYLPESFGVKCFNKSTPVEKWSTMASNDLGGANQPTCDICRMIINCEECCSFCQAIEMQKCLPPSLPQAPCFECDNDDILLDESTLKNFHEPPAHVVEEISRPLRTKHDHFLPLSFFDRIRRLTFRLGSRKSTNKSRLWSRIRSGSQRLRRSSRRLARSGRNHSTKPISRIFLPFPNESGENSNGAAGGGGTREYAEQYLKAPSGGEKNKESNLNKTNGNVINEHVERNGKVNGTTKVPVGKVSDLRRSEKTFESSSITPEKTIKTKTRKAVDQSGQSLELKTKKNGARSSVKPFFISHPISQNGITELNHNGQVLSMSSDSGMEEFDCHSSTENSPSGYGMHDVPRISLFDYERSLLNSTKAAHELNRLYRQQQQQRRGASEEIRTPSSRHMAPQQQLSRESYNVKSTTMASSPAIAASPSVKDVRRQAGHWFNLENELGYIP